MSVSVVSSFEAHGDGKLTVADLEHALSAFPGEAWLKKVELGDNQMDGPWWRITAEIRHEI